MFSKPRFWDVNILIAHIGIEPELKCSSQNFGRLSVYKSIVYSTDLGPLDGEIMGWDSWKKTIKVLLSSHNLPLSNPVRGQS